MARLGARWRRNLLRLAVDLEQDAVCALQGQRDRFVVSSSWSSPSAAPFPSTAWSSPGTWWPWPR